MLKVGVLCSGRGSNLQAIIDASKEGKIKAKVVVVISDNEKALALERARRDNIPAIYINPSAFSSKEEYEAAIIKELRSKGVELVALAGFMRVLSPYFVKAYQNRIMNIHPSLLPAFPGLEAQKQAFDYGVKVAGATVHFVDFGIDTGPIIIQAAVPVKEDDTPESLAERILKEEHRIYPKAIDLFAQNKLKIEGRKVKIL
jgi:phosphoribosylglycinamide formyltransferase-1